MAEVVPAIVTRNRASLCQQLWAFLIRNFQIKKKAKRHTITEIVMPLYFVAILLIIRRSIPDTVSPALLKPQTTYPITPLQPLSSWSTVAVVNLATSQFDGVIDKLRVSYTVLNYTSVEAMLDAYNHVKSPSSGMPLFDVGVVFTAWTNSTVSYTFRTQPESSLPDPDVKYATADKCRPKWSDNPQRLEVNEIISDCPARKYLGTGFVTLQAIIDTAIIEAITGGKVKCQLSGRVFPKDKFVGSTAYLRSFVPMYMVIAFTPFVSYLCILVVGEKEKKLKDAMKLMGLRESVYWIGWFVTYGVIVAVLSLIIVVLLVEVQVLPNANIFLLYIIFLLYGLSTITIAFVLTPFFNSAKMAGGVASFSTTVFSLLYYLSVYVQGIPPSAFYALSLLSPTAFALGLDKAVYLDLIGEGINYSNFWQDGYCFGSSVVMLVVDIILYGFLAFYFDNVIPGEYGRKRKPWFILMPSFWCQRPFSESLLAGDGGRVNDFSGNPNIEKISHDLVGKDVLRVFNLRKVYKGLRKPEVVAVDDISLDIYEGQITAILGHNGAGKTTLLNMLVGLIAPTDGTATMYGLDIGNANNFDHIYQMVGVCPQQDVIFDSLTTRQHLEFFGRIKNITKSSLQNKIYSILTEVDLLDQIDTQSTKLSGGQKRKLSMAIALIGDPKIIVLDEPTSGVDPYSRRRLWNLLQKCKAGRVILLTTHFMDEADILADRKAIISGGKVKCIGSSLFLKNRFGLGYHLTMVCNEEQDVASITQLVRSHIATAKKIRSNAVELTFLLPSSDVSLFSALLADLDETIATRSVGIRSYGISMTTLEEVFLKIGEDDTDMTLAGNDTRRPSTATVNSRRALVAAETQFNWFQAFVAVIKLQLIVTLRVPRNIVTTVITPIILLSVSFFLMKQKMVEVETGSAMLGPTYYPLYSGLYQSDGASVLSFVNAALNENINLTAFVGDFSALLSNAPHSFLLEFDSFSLTKQSLSTNLLIDYNDTEQHSLPIVVNTIDNVVLNLLSSTTSPVIEVFSEPLPRHDPSPDVYGSALAGTILIGMLYNMVLSVFASESVEDRELKVKHQLHVSGLPFHVYWFAKFVGNALLFCITLVITVIVIEAFQVTSFMGFTQLSLLVVVYLLYILAALPYGYCFGYVFDKYETAQSFLNMIFLIVSFAPYMAFAMCDMLQLNDGATGRTLHYLFTVLFPLYSPFAIIYYINKVHVRSLFEPVSVSDYYSSEVVAMLIALPIQAVVCFAVLWILDFRSTNGRWSQLLRCGRRSGVVSTSNYDLNESEDDDVRHERQRVQNMTSTDGSPVVILNGLRKEFVSNGKSSCLRRKKQNSTDTVKVAVRNLSFAVDKAEVFGLLGPNGAGKTTALRTMVADEVPTNGKVIVAGYDMCSDVTKAIRSMGYCPQHDALWKNATLKEHLDCYAAVRGVKRSEVSTVVSSIMNKLQIEEHASKEACKLSGGTKRKLSFAISMLGNPKIVLLDEPSTGMDPQSKRYLWDTITSSFQGGRGAVLTTHSMEEADVLCSRVGIMVRGDLRCIGSSQHLKNKYGSGYTLESKVIVDASHSQDERLAFLDELIRRLFPNAVMQERFEDRVKYQIPQTGGRSLADIFAALEKAKKEIGVEEYSFSQTTLEQVFLEFAKEQVTETDTAPNKNN